MSVIICRSKSNMFFNNIKFLPGFVLYSYYRKLLCLCIEDVIYGIKSMALNIFSFAFEKFPIQE